MKNQQRHFPCIFQYLQTRKSSLNATSRFEARLTRDIILLRTRNSEPILYYYEPIGPRIRMPLADLHGTIKQSFKYMQIVDVNRLYIITLYRDIYMQVAMNNSVHSRTVYDKQIN